MGKILDFICVGAAKSATTTLFDLIKNHPQIYIPVDKELPYFSDNNIYKKGWSWYMRSFFSSSGNKKNKITGTITPQYMTGIGKASPEIISKRMAKQLPEVKLIVLLRHPVERAYSHYKMHRRNNYLADSFEDASKRLINANLQKERKNLTPKNIFLLSSEYGRILKNYYAKFPRKNILVLFTDDLNKSPAKTLEQVFKFLGVNQKYKPDNIYRKSHTGGKAKIKYLSPAYLEKMPPVNFLWKKLVPFKMRKKIFMMITRWNITSDNDKIDPDSKIYKQLVEFFREDVKLLEAEAKMNVPWKDWNDE